MGRPLNLEVRVDHLKMRQPFVISGYVFDEVPTLVVTLSDGRVAGRGEASGVYYLGDDAPRMTAAIEAIRPRLEAGLSRAELQSLLPAGGARNAVDCALWELEAGQTGRQVWEVAGLAPPRPLLTTMTAGADEPDAMADVVRAFPDPRAVKLKLTGEPELDVARVAAVRSVRPAAWLGVDANQGYTLERLRDVLPAFVRHGVKLVEQPLPRGQEAALDGLVSPIPLAADESVQSSADLDALVGRFQVINIKLDKCGGLTEGLAMVERGRALGFEIMVGCMAGSSWAMAAAFLVGQACDVVDLDSPLALKTDRDPAASYRDGMVWCGPDVWGGANHR